MKSNDSKTIGESIRINLLYYRIYYSLLWILLSIPFENRFAYPNTTFMIHSAYGLAIGCVDEIEDSLAEIKRLNKIIYKIITDNTKITEEQLEHYEERKKDWIIDAETALELGLISKIL